MADAIYDIAETDDQIDAIVDTLRMQLKMFLADSPPLPEVTDMRRGIVITIDEHDFDQVILLAKINKIKPHEMAGRIVRAYLDGRTLREEKSA